MRYETFSDYLIDNRNGIEHSLNSCENKAEVIEEALEAYDFAAMKALEHHESYKLFKKAVEKAVGREMTEKIEKDAARHFMELGKGVERYYRDVESGKKVGYSAEEEE